MEWISAAETLAAFCRAGLSREVAVTEIYSLIKLGALRAKAGRFFVGDEEKPGGDTLPSGFWENAPSYRQSWELGRFTSDWLPQAARGPWQEADPIPLKALGVLFSREDITAAGAVLKDQPSLPVPSAPDVEKVESVDEWAARMVRCKLNIGGFNKAILHASWIGPGDPPAVKVALAALQDEWARNGRVGPGSPGKA